MDRQRPDRLSANTRTDSDHTDFQRTQGQSATIHTFREHIDQTDFQRTQGQTLNTHTGQIGVVRRISSQFTNVCSYIDIQLTIQVYLLIFFKHMDILAYNNGHEICS